MLEFSHRANLVRISNISAATVTTIMRSFDRQVRVGQCCVGSNYPGPHIIEILTAVERCAIYSKWHRSHALSRDKKAPKISLTSGNSPLFIDTPVA